MKRRAWLGLLLLLAATAIAAPAPEATEGFVTAEKNVELYYVKVGRGAQTVILPARLFTFEDFRWLAERYTVISYDMRNRGRSSRVEDLAKVSLEADVADLEAIRRHFGVDKAHLIGYSYLGLMVMLYALDHPQHVERLGSGPCEMPNEWPANLARHFVGSVQKLDVPRERVAKLKKPVLTIHGTSDRNAPYGGGREWAYLLPDARLLVLQGAAHQAFAERPEVVRPAIDEFLQGKWPATAEKVSADPRLAPQPPK